MRNILLVLLGIIVLTGTACKKTTFSSKPQLKYKSTNTKELRYGDVLEMRLTFTDAEGDLVSDSALYVEQFSNFCPGTTFKQVYPLSEFPTTTNMEGTILVTYGYRVAPFLREPQCGATDTCYFRFVLRDKEKNVSDTVVSDGIVIYK